MKTIRGRILLAFLILCLLIAPFLLFSFVSLRKINNSKNLKEQVDILNINRLKAINHFDIAIKADIKLDSFYITETSSNFKKQRHYIDLAKQSLRLAQYSEFPKSNIIPKRIQGVEDEIENIIEKSNKVVELQLRRGFRDYGLEGLMREKIHALENNSEGLTLAENLMLRRREKDYFLRDDLHYADLLNTECEVLITKLSKSEDAIKTKKALAEYLAIFNEIVAIEQEIGNESLGLLFELNQANTALDKKVAKLSEVIETDLNYLESSIKSYIILFFGLTIAFAIVFAFLFSGHIAKPIQGLIQNMDTISEENFKENHKITSKFELKELKILTQKYNDLVAKIRNQIRDLHSNNNELYDLTLKLSESENELKEASAIKDKFFSIISHDLRGHTGNILSLANILDQDGNELSENEKSVFVKYMVDSSQNLQLLLDNLLNWAKSQMNDHDISKKSFNIGKLVENNIELFKDNSFRKKVKITFKNNDRFKAYADKDMVDFIIRNLLSNALKFTKSGDTISFKISEVGVKLKVEITDTGVGMSKDEIEVLLNSDDGGFTKKGTENEVGTGLGFSICKDFVRRNGGEIEITSKKGKGSTFSFTLPTSLTRESIENLVV
ncbi:sensor histidine kinase [Croceitalea rosinachiae]|uniref:histidine kinase n=1 Tax=Croceitalea rosinachiae TaxID=3075596 RepID=A0ABU3AD23_9FLAO|nr:ATP-binding protein [Croceitalea sp. F388]MDT0607700.1 ATP-binding protein [Croceitalea sp. F388]